MGFDLGILPTPLHRLERLGAVLDGPELWIKRDDLIGIGDGGNKIRKLRSLMAAAIAEGCDCVLTAGAQQSNHCRQTAAASALCGLECHLALGGEEPPVRSANLLLSTLFGAHVHWCGDDRKGEQLDAIAARLRAEGRRPYVIPYGGSNALGARGFVEAAHELLSQCASHEITFDHLFVASSSGGTQAGLLAGFADAPWAPKIHGVLVDPTQDLSALRRHVARLADGCSADAGPTIGIDDVLLDDTGIEDDYGTLGSGTRAAIERLARAEGILVDPVYSGRALRALLARIEDGSLSRGERVLFWHTGGTTALHAYATQLART